MRPNAPEPALSADRPPDAGRTLREYAGAVWKRRRLVVALGVLGAVAGWWQGSRSPDVYGVSLRIDIAKQRPLFTNSQQLSAGETYHASQLYYPTQYALLASRTYVDRLCEGRPTEAGSRFPMWDWLTWPAYAEKPPKAGADLNLGPAVESAAAFEGIVNVSAAEFARRFPFRRYGPSPRPDAPHDDPSDLAGFLANKVVVQPEKGTTLVTIELEGEQREVLAPLLNLLIEVFWREQRSETQRRLDRESRMRQDERRRLDRPAPGDVRPEDADPIALAKREPSDLAKAEEALAEWKKKYAANANSLDLQKQYRATQRVGDEAQLRGLEETLVGSEPDFEALLPAFADIRMKAQAAAASRAAQDGENTAQPLPPASVEHLQARAADAAWDEALVGVQKEAEAALAAAAAGTRFHAMAFVIADPAVAPVLLRLQNVEAGAGPAPSAAIVEPIRKQLNSAARDAVLKKIRELRQSLGLRVLVRDRIREGDAMLERQWRLSAELAALQKRVDDLVAERTHIDEELKRIDAQMAVENDSKPLKVILSAEDPRRPSKPNRPLLIVLGAAVGLLLGLSLALLVDWLDDTVSDPEDVARHVGAPIVGTILSLPGKVADRVAVELPRSPVAEAFRAVRTSVEFAGDGGVGTGGRVLLVTSCSPREGKTTVASNLAFALAQDGKRTLLVDADLRKPRVHQVLEVDATRGLSNVVVGRVRPEEAVVGTKYENLWVLPAGALPPNPAELLGRAGTKALFDALRTAFDRIVVDSPPVGVVTDAAVLARHADQVLLVVAAGRTKKRAAEHGAAVLRSVGAPPAGVVINLVSKGSRWAYGGYYHKDSRLYYGADAEGGAGA